MIKTVSFIRKPVFVFAALCSIAGLTASDVLAFPVHVGTSPENTLSLTLSAIQSAHESILLNVYEFASPEIAQALIDQINRGVHVEILQEGQPVGGVATAARGIQSKVLSAMETHPGNRYLEMTSAGSGARRRFHYDHAKYIVIDQSRLLVGSENYGPSGQPEPGTIGNRGWEVFVEDASSAQFYAQIFAKDSDQSESDIRDLLRGSATMDLTSGRTRRPKEPRPTQPTQPGSPDQPSTSNPTFDASAGQIITSPDTSLQGTLNLINSAQSTLDIEQMSFNLNWRGGGQQQISAAPVSDSPLYKAIADAAHRGVKVRILLNDENAFKGGHNQDGVPPENGIGAEMSVMDLGVGSPRRSFGSSTSRAATTTNRKTVARFMELAQQGLPIEARIANLKGMGVTYIHNKGVIVDHNQTLVSSINWTENAITSNREAAIVLTGSEIAGYFESSFDKDWNVSAGTSLISAQNAQMDFVPLEASAPLNALSPSYCPQKMKATVEIGALDLGDADPSYGSLANKTLTGSFKRDSRARRCLLVGPGNLFFAIQKKADGEYTIDLEGYTSKSKTFSVQGKLSKSSEIAEGASFDVDAQVVEGSAVGGGRKHFLGDATLSLEIQ